MSYKFNPFTGNLDLVGEGGGGSATPAGDAGEIQINDGEDPAGLGAVAGFSYDTDADVLNIPGDINLDDSGDYTTTLQTVTPTADRTISFPDATGTIGLVAGSTGQIVFNDAGAYAGVSTATVSSGNITLTGRFISSLNGAASAPPATLTGTWFTGGTATTTKPQFLLEPAGTTSAAWSTSGTGLGVNAASGFAGNLLDLQVNGTSQLSVSPSAINTTSTTLHIGTAATGASGIFAGALIFRGLFIGQGNLFRFASSVFSTRANISIGWSSSTSGSYTAEDLLIVRDAAGTLAQRNGTNAQTTRLYNTFTSATDFERAKLQWDTDVLKVGTEKGADGGTARDMELQTDGTTRITLKADGAILFSGIPTSDPTVAGQLWNDGGTLKISAG